MRQMSSTWDPVGKVGQKFNSIQSRLFSEVDGLNRKQLARELSKWLRGS